MIRDRTFQMSSEIHLFLQLTCYQSAVNGWGLQVHFNDFWSKDFFHHNFAFTKNHRRHLCFPSLHPRPDNHAGFERLYAPIFFEKTDFGFLEIHVPEMMHVKYVLVGYLSMHVLCCLCSFKKKHKTILLRFHQQRNTPYHNLTNSPSSLPSWPLQLVAQPVVPPLHQSQGLPLHPQTSKAGHVDAFPVMTWGHLLPWIFKTVQLA